MSEQTQREQGGTWHPLNIVTWNFGRARPSTDVQWILREMMKERPAFIGSQEVVEHLDVLDWVSANSPYRAVIGDERPGARRTAVLYDTRQVRLIERHQHHLMPLRRGDPEAAGDPDYGPKWAVGGEFKHLASGRTPVVWSVHQVPSVHLRGQKPLAAEFMSSLAERAAAVPGLVLLPGDYNAVAGHESLSPLHRVGLTSDHERLGAVPTLGRRGIDAVFATPGYRMTGHSVRRLAFDHSPVLVRGLVLEAV